MKRWRVVMGLTFALVLVFGLTAQADYVYKVNEKHQGGNVTPVEAFKMLEKDPKHSFLVDCRTRYEYQVVGHPMNAYNIPTKFFTTKVGKKGYGKSVNANFGKDLLARFNPKTDTLLFMCRSGNRSCTACNMAIKVGWPKNKVFNIMGGFEGGKNKNKFCAFHGRRWAGGWRLEGLPWTYKMDKKFMYKADLK